MGIFQAINIWSVDDWRCEFVGKRVSESALKSMQHDAETDIGRVRFKLWHKIEDDGPIDWIEKYVWVNLYVSESGINRGRISFIVCEEFEDRTSSDLNDHHKHFRHTWYRNATNEEAQLANTILSPIVVDDSKEMACRLIWHIQSVSKTSQFRDFEIAYNRNFNRDRIDTDLRIETVAAIIRCAYNFIEAFFNAHFREELTWVHNHDHLPMINMLDAEWFYQGMNLSLKIKLCRDRLIRQMKSYLSLANQSETEMGISLRALLEERFQQQYQKCVARKAFVRKEDKITKMELINLDLMNPEVEIIQQMSSLNEDTDNPLLRRIKTVSARQRTSVMGPDIGVTNNEILF